MTWWPSRGFIHRELQAAYTEGNEKAEGPMNVTKQRFRLVYKINRICRFYSNHSKRPWWSPLVNGEHSSIPASFLVSHHLSRYLLLVAGTTLHIGKSNTLPRSRISPTKRAWATTTCPLSAHRYLCHCEHC